LEVAQLFSGAKPKPFPKYLAMSVAENSVASSGRKHTNQEGIRVSSRRVSQLADKNEPGKDGVASL